MFGLIDVCEHGLHEFPRNIKEAKQWLDKLNRSPLSFHLDDDPIFCLNGDDHAFDGPTAWYLNHVVQECRNLLGDPEIWRLYHDRFSEEPSSIAQLG